MRRVLAALLAAALFLGLVGCEGNEDDLTDTLMSIEPSVEPSSAPQIVVPVGSATVEAFGAAYSSTAALDPINSQSRLNLELAPLMYEGLFTLNGSFEAEKQLCESFSHSGETWTIVLRKGVKMSDGGLLTSADVKYSLDLARRSERFASRLQPILSVAATDEYTVVITTNGVYGRLELLLDVPIVRADSGEEYAPPGSGLYEYVEAGDESYLRVADAHRGEANIARIQLIDTPEAELMISNFEQGLISVASYDPTATDRIDYGGDREEWSYPTTRMVYLNFSSRMDETIRAVLAGAIDRETIASIDLLGAADASERPANPASPTGARPGTFSLERGVAALDALGAEVGQDGIRSIGKTRLAVRFIVPEENACKRAAAERIAVDWRQLGFDVTLDTLSFAEFKGELSLGDFDVALCETQMLADFSLDALLGEGGTLNFGGFADEELAALLDRYRAADDDSIARAANALYGYVSRSAPIAPIAFLRSYLMARRGEVAAPDPTAHDLYRGVADW